MIGGNQKGGGGGRGMPADVPPLKILYPRYPSLRIADHFREEVAEAGATELCGASSI